MDGKWDMSYSEWDMSHSLYLRCPMMLALDQMYVVDVATVPMRLVVVGANAVVGGDGSDGGNDGQEGNPRERILVG